MEWFARLFRVRAAPPPSLRGVLAGCLCAALLLTTTACGGTTKSASTAIQGLDDIIRAGKSAPLDDLTRQREALRKLPDNSFSADDLAVRNALLRRSELLLVDLIVATIDDSVKTQVNAAAQKAKVTATNALDNTRTWNEKFVADFADVTKDIITGVACGKILDQIAPDERPTEPGAATPAERATREAVDKLAARHWATASLIVNWDYYLESVLEGATQFAQGVDGLSTTYIAALGNPGVRKAVVVYLRTCYTPPKPFPSR